MSERNEADQINHDRLLRIEEKLDKIGDRLADGSRRMDGLERKILDVPCIMHGERIQAIEDTNKKALAAWGIIVLVGTAILSVVWEELKKRLTGP
jgi:hypothetical protein